MFNSPTDWCKLCKAWVPITEDCTRGKAYPLCPLAAVRSKAMGGTAREKLYRMRCATRPAADH